MKMRIYFLILSNFLLIIFLDQKLFGQEFVFDLYFQDNQGNRDTITLGYDHSATDSIDISQGEIDILGYPLDTTFDVRISNIWENKRFGNNVNFFQTKRQILNNSCNAFFPVVTIDIYCKNWPVLISWDSTLFTDACNLGSLMTSVIPGGWFDVCCGFKTEFSQSSSMTIQKLKYNTTNSTDQYYINDSGDTIFVIWQAFGDDLTDLKVLQTSDENYYFYPNPSNGTISLNGILDEVDNIQLFDVKGKKLIHSKVMTLDINILQNGLYVALIELKNGSIIHKKILKSQ